MPAAGSSPPAGSARSALAIPDATGGADRRMFYVAPPYIDADALPTTTIAVPIVGGSDDPGWIVAEISLEELWRMVDSIRVGTTATRC